LTLTPSVVCDEPQILVSHTADGYNDTRFTDFLDEKVAAMKTEMEGRTDGARQGICERTMEQQLSDHQSCLERHLEGTRIEVTTVGVADPTLDSNCGCQCHTVDECFLHTRGFAIVTETYQTEEDPNRTLCRSRYYKKTRRSQETPGISCPARPPPPSLNSHEATRLDRYRDNVNDKVQEIVSQYDEECRHSLMELKDKSQTVTTRSGQW
jgi:hypothetical protein